MANTKGNAYVAWFITPNYQVFARDAQGNVFPKSKTGFARDLDISLDGTVWVVSRVPDPDGGGGKLYWSDGSDQWHVIDNKAPGGMRISGTGFADSCYYLTSQFQVWAMDTQGHFRTVPVDPVTAFSCGFNFMWGMKPDKEGGIPVLNYCPIVTGNLKLVKFAGDLQPRQFCVDPIGYCCAIINDSPVRLGNDGHSKYPIASGADGKAVAISMRSRTYLLTNDNNADGYQVMTTQGGNFVNIPGFRAIKVAATYYS